ncbi:MAG: LytR C-terminal domain-containing protein [Flaviflexus sp.]|uniref:LytR C-terminal domain-containing protein n=1 Tax=Flaviflexus sp. TaxID=1969482 RepID=UPI00352C89D5
MEQYPKDEFDELADSRHMRGSHRKKRSPLRFLIPFGSVIIIAPLLGWGVVELMSQDGMTNPFIKESTEAATDNTTPTDASTDSTDEPTDDETTVPGDDQTDGSTDEPTDGATGEETPTVGETEEVPSDIETLPPVAGVAYDSSILLYNGTGVPDGADQALNTLQVAGYTNVTVEDYAAANPATTALYFASNDLYGTAQNLAQNLVIDYWAESAGMTGGNDILIVLR